VGGTEDPAGTKMREPLIIIIQKRTARVAISPSTVRGQGVPGIAAAGRRFLAALDLRAFVSSREEVFQRELDKATEQLQVALPGPARHWGLARKILNIFLRDALYNHYLRQEYGLSRVEFFLEVPLDSLSAQGLRERRKQEALPRWTGVSRLTPAMSEAYQGAAARLADAWGISRVHLDAYLWSDR